MRHFPVDEIQEWLDKRGETGTTALCPFCDVDSVLPARIKHCVGDEMEEYLVTEKDLLDMRNYWFNTI